MVLVGWCWWLLCCGAVLLPAVLHMATCRLARSGGQLLTCCCAVLCMMSRGEPRSDVPDAPAPPPPLQEWPLLVIVPASMRLVWAEELERWLPHLRPSQVHVVEGKEGRLSGRCGAGVVGEGWCEAAGGLCVVCGGQGGQGVVC